MSLESSIEIWLEAVYESSQLGSDESAHDLPIETLALRAASHIFGCGLSTTADLAATVAEEMDIDITSLLPGIINISKLCLLHAVSSNCPKRAEYVQGIIALDPVVQGQLMQVIKSGSTACMVVDIVEDDEPPSPPRPSKKRDREEAADCRACGDIAKELAHLQATLRRAVEKEEEDNQKYHRELSLRDNRLMDIELQLIQRDDRISELLQEAEQAHSTVREQRTELETIGQLSEQIQLLQDEIECLRPRAERADALEATTDRLKLKLDEMSDLRQQLAAESAAHLKTQNKYVDAAREVDALRKTKAQLDEYRSKCTELEISGNELAIKLSLVTKELESLSGKNEDLNESQKDKTEATQCLMEELQAAQARLRELDRCGGIGQGMSELNPELMMELHSLRSENEKLAHQLNMSSVESLERLEKHLDDAKSINTSLQAKWMDTKDLLAQSRAEASSLSQAVSNWSLRFRTLECKSAELQQLGEEDRAALQARYNEMNRLSAECHHMELTTAIITRNALVESVELQLQQTESKLSDTIVQLEQKCTQNTNLICELESARASIANMEQQIRDLNTQFERDLVAAKENHSAIVDLLKKNELKRLEDMDRKHSSVIQSKDIEISATSSELDLEKKKRRRTEREKRILEGDVHKYKTQAQINSSTASGSNAEVTEVLKEMKAMQKTIDQISEENVYLRNMAQLSAGPAEQSAPTGEGLLMGGAGRVLAGGTQRRSTRLHHSERDAIPSGGGNVCSSGTASFGDYLEQTDISDKRMEQLVREKREIMAKNLEESKEKMELAQKLLQSERENSQLKSKVTKLTLENERYQRKVMLGADKAKSLIAKAVTEENVPNLASNYPKAKKALF